MKKSFIQNAALAALLTSTFMVPTVFAKESPHNQDATHHVFQQNSQQQTREQAEQQAKQQIIVSVKIDDNHGKDFVKHSTANQNETAKANHKQEVQALHAEIDNLHKIQQQERSVHSQLNAAIHSLISRIQKDIQSGNTADLSSLSTGLVSLGSDLKQAVQDGSTANQDVKQAQTQAKAKSITGIQNVILQIKKVETLKLQKIAAMQKAIQDINAILSALPASTATAAPSSNVGNTTTSTTYSLTLNN